MKTSLEMYQMLLRDFTHRFMAGDGPAQMTADQQIEINGRTLNIRLREAAAPETASVLLFAALGTVFAGQEDLFLTRLLQLNNLCVRTEGFAVGLDQSGNRVVVQASIPLDQMNVERLLQMLLRLIRAVTTVERVLDQASGNSDDNRAAMAMHELPGASHA